MRHPSLRSHQQSHRRRQCKALGLTGKALGIEGDEGIAGTAACMVQRVGKIQAPLQIADRGLHRRAILDLDMLKRQQMLEHATHVGSQVAVTATQDRKSTRLNSSHGKLSRMPSSA